MRRGPDFSFQTNSSMLWLGMLLIFCMLAFQYLLVQVMYGEIEDKLTELGIDGVRCDPTTRRLYPQNTLASVVLGHTDYEGNGIYGLEAYYDDYLSGIDGRIITAKASDGTEIPYRYKQSYDAQDGDDGFQNDDENGHRVPSE